MSVYLWLITGIIVVPLLLSFERRVEFYRNYRALFPAIVITGILFLIWDAAATARGDWAFNDRFILGLRWEGIPLEEILFFLAAPYSCLFIYDVVSHFIPERKLSFPRGGAWLCFAALVAVAVVYARRPYTLTVALVSAGTILAGKYGGNNLFVSFRYWLFMLTAMVPFVISNYILTSLPVVTYNSAAIIGARFLTIPYEDFLYNFALLTLNLRLYLKFRRERGQHD